MIMKIITIIKIIIIITEDQPHISNYNKKQQKRKMQKRGICKYLNKTKVSKS